MVTYVHVFTGMECTLGISVWVMNADESQPTREEICAKDEIDAMFFYISDNETGNFIDEVAAHQKDALDKMFFYCPEKEPEISSDPPGQDALDNIFVDYQELEQSSFDSEPSKSSSNDSQSQRVHRHKHEQLPRTKVEPQIQ